MCNIFIQTGGIGLAPDKTPLLNKKERDFFVPQNWSSTQDRKRDRSRDNFLDDEPEISTLKPRNNNRRRILKKTDEKKNIGESKILYKTFVSSSSKQLQQTLLSSSLLPLRRFLHQSNTWCFCCWNNFCGKNQEYLVYLQMQFIFLS